MPDDRCREMPGTGPSSEPQIRAQVRKLQAQRLAQAREKQARADAAKPALAAPATVACEDDGWRWNPLKKKDEACGERR